VHAAAERTRKAHQAALEAKRLREEALEASRQANTLERELGRAKKEAAMRKARASAEDSSATEAQNKAASLDGETRSEKSTIQELEEEASAKGKAFVRDEKKAAESREAAKQLLASEESARKRSIDLFRREAEAKDSEKREAGSVRELRGEEETRLVMEHGTVSLKVLDPASSTAPADKAAVEKKLAAGGVHAKGGKQAKKGQAAKRPLWGSRRWPSYYYNPLSARKGSFSADAPTRRERSLDRGDDDTAIDSRQPEPAKPKAQLVVAGGGEKGRVQGMWEEDEQKGGGDKRGARAVVLPRPSLKALEEMTPQQRDVLVRDLAARDAPRAAAAPTDSQDRREFLGSGEVEKFGGDVRREEEPLYAMASTIARDFRREAADEVEEREALEAAERRGRRRGEEERRNGEEQAEQTLSKKLADEEGELMEGMREGMRRATRELEEREEEQVKAIAKGEAKREKLLRADDEGKAKNAVEEEKRKDEGKEKELKAEMTAAVRTCFGFRV
jgi:hypothetical protein